MICNMRVTYGDNSVYLISINGHIFLIRETKSQAIPEKEKKRTANKQEWNEIRSLLCTVYSKLCMCAHLQ